MSSCQNNGIGFEYRLHAVNKIDVEDQHNICVRNNDVVCDIDFLSPLGLSFRQTDQYDPNPRPRITLREWHLTATTPEKKKQVEFVAIYRPHRIEDQIPKEANLEQTEGGYALRVKLSDGEFAALLPTDDHAFLKAQGLESKGTIKVQVKLAGKPAQITGLEE